MCRIFRWQVGLGKTGKFAGTRVTRFFRSGSTIELKFTSRCLFTTPHGLPLLIRANTEQLDQLLDELEDLARSELSSSQFLAVLLQRLRSTVSATLAAVMLPAGGEQWWPLASSGQSPHAAEVERAIAHRLVQTEAEKRSSLAGSQADEAWLAVPLRPKSFEKGYLLITHTADIPQSAVAGLVEVLAAFAEVLQVRQLSDLEGFMDKTWDQVQGLCLQLSQAPSHEQAAAWLVNGLARSLDAARVSVLNGTVRSTPRVLSVSGIAKFNASADAIRGLQAIAAELQRTAKPLLRQQTSPSAARSESILVEHPSTAPESLQTDESLSAIASDGCFANLLGLRLAAHTAATSATSAQAVRGPEAPAIWLIIEYQTHADMVRSLTRLPHVLPAVAVAWDQQLRWLRLPKLARSSAFSAIPRLQLLLRRLTWPLLIALLLLMVWALQQPYPLTVEAEGVYEPVVSRAIYAADDGFVAELLVQGGTNVSSGDPLVRLRSPALELRMEQASGELRGVIEETSGIRIAINQLDLEASEALNNQSRLASKIVELETKHEYLQRQIDMLQTQHDSLLLRSPIDGIVVAKDLQRHLTGRPVRRGDALFSIVDLAGPWQIRVQVADRDSEYLRAHYVSHQSAELPEAGNSLLRTSNSALAFTLTSNPAERWAAKLRWIAEQVENRDGQGCFVEVRADVGSDERCGAHAGAGVHAFFSCGDQPLWFVWSRPLVEAAQRKLWFRNPTDE